MRSSILTILFFSILLIVAAKQSVAQQAPSTRTIRIQLTAMIWNDGATLAEIFGHEEGQEFPQGPVLYLWTGGTETIPLQIPYGARSLPIEYRGPAEVIFLKRPFDEEIENDQPPVAARVTIERGIRSALVLLVPEDVINNDFRGLVLDESQSNFAPTSVRFINMSDDIVGIVLDSNREIIQPQSQKILSLNPDQGRSTSVTFAKRGKGNDDPLITSRTLRVFNGVRHTCFIINNPNGSANLLIRTVSEDTRFAPPEPSPIDENEQ